MSERVASPVSTDDHRTPAAAKVRPSLNAAYLAAPLWALQAVIWIAAPKVQEQSAPYTITNPVLFALFWLSIAGAVAFSAAAAIRIPAHMGAPGSRMRSAAVVLAVLAAALAAAATVSISVALIPAAQPLALTLMTNLLNAATVILAASLILSAVVSWRARHSARRSVAAPRCSGRCHYCDDHRHPGQRHPLCGRSLLRRRRRRPQRCRVVVVGQIHRSQELRT